MPPLDFERARARETAATEGRECRQRADAGCVFFFKQKTAYEIDRLDEQLVKLLNARSQCAIELGRIKRELGLAIYSPDREREVIGHVTGINNGPLDRDAVRQIGRASCRERVYDDV